MASINSQKRTSKTEYQVFFWGGRILFFLAFGAFLFFLWSLYSHWATANTLYRLQNIKSVLNQHIFWHLKIQQDVARLYTRDVLIEVNQQTENKGPITQQVSAQYQRYGTSSNRNITPQKIPLPEEYFLIKLKEFYSNYNHIDFLDAIEHWQMTLNSLLEKSSWNLISNYVFDKRYENQSINISLEGRNAKDAFLSWKSRSDAVNSWRSIQLMTSDEINARQIFLLREWISDVALDELKMVQFKIEEINFNSFKSWRFLHYQLILSFFISVMSVVGFWWLWLYRNDGNNLFESPNAYFTDRLTGLFNRDHFNAIGTKLLKESQEKGFLISVVTIQIHQFKQLNDVYGFSVGDKVLQFLSKRIRENLRATDQLSRVGGGEFAILLPKSTKEGVSVFAKRLRGSLERLSVIGSYGETVNFTVKISEESCTPEDEAISEILQRAMQ